MAAQLVVFELPIKHAHIIKHLQQLQWRGFCVYVLPSNDSVISSQQEYPVQTFPVWNTLLLWATSLTFFHYVKVYGETVSLDKGIGIAFFVVY